jgi:hypothetical protein
MVLKWAALFFASLSVDVHGTCHAYSVHRERAYPNYWWACGACVWERDGESYTYAARVLLACTKSECVRLRHWPKNVDPGVCEASP